MFDSKNNWNGMQSGEAEAAHEVFSPGGKSAEPLRPREPEGLASRVNSADGGILLGAPKKKQKKRTPVHAGYSELLALESEAQKINLWRPTPRSSQVIEEDSQPAERALRPGKNSDGAELLLRLPNPESAVFLDANRPVLMAVDQRMSMHFGSGRELKSVVAVRVAALIAWRMLASRKPMGTSVFNDQRISELGVGCNRLHTLLTLQSLVNQNHDLSPEAPGRYSNPRMLNDALRSLKKLAADPFIFLITDASGGDEETFRLATDIFQGNNLVIIMIYDPSQTRCVRFARQRRVERCFFPEGVPVVTINTRRELMRQLRRALTTSALRSSAARQSWRSGLGSPTPGL